MDPKNKITIMDHKVGIEPTTFRLSVRRSNQVSYLHRVIISDLKSLHSIKTMIFFVFSDTIFNLLIPTFTAFSFNSVDS